MIKRNYEKFLLEKIHKINLSIEINLDICFIKKNEVMPSKTLVRNCNCIHCKQKLEQINRSRVYWDKVIINKLNE